jgi:hypothetical protein
VVNERIDRAPAAERVDEHAGKRLLAPAPPLVFLASDADAVCVDDVCLTPEQRELVEDGRR